VSSQLPGEHANNHTGEHRTSHLLSFVHRHKSGSGSRNLYIAGRHAAKANPATAAFAVLR
jgi:hypothetical protein